jgi:transcriptional regulator with XRE-family HTH domain
MDVKKALKGLQWTQKDLSTYLDISQPKISMWLNNRAAVTEPETILTQMLSFLEAEKMNIRTKTSTGSSAEHSTGRKEGGSSYTAQNTSLN